MKFISVIFVFSLLSSLVFAGPIPAPSCKHIGKNAAQLNGSQNPKLFQFAATELQKLNSPYELANYIQKLIENGVKETSFKTLIRQNPYIEDMNFPLVELTNSFREIKTSGDTSFVNIKRKLIKNISAFRAGKKTFSPKRDYDIELELIGIKNQCRLGSCWAYASVAYLELLVKHFKSQIERNPEYAEFKNIDESQLQLAVEHYYALYIINEIKLSIADGKTRSNDELFIQGGTFRNFMAYAKSFGMGVPQNQWAPFKSYKKAMFKDKFLDALKEMALTRHDEIELVKQEKMPFPERVRKIKQIKKIAYEEIEAIVETYTSELDHKISINDSSLSPKDFFQKFMEPFVSKMQVSSLAEFNYESYSEASRVRVLDKNQEVQINSFPYKKNYMKEVKHDRFIINTLRQGKPLYVAMKIPTSTFKDKKTGETHQIINASNGLTTMYRVDGSPKIRGGHALVIVGVELNAQGKIVTYKIQNSWGDAHGDKGILHVSRSFGDTHFKYVVTLD